MVAPRFESPPSTYSSPSRLASICGTPPFWTGSRVPPGASKRTRVGATSIASCAFVAKTIRSNVLKNGIFNQWSDLSGLDGQITSHTSADQKSWSSLGSRLSANRYFLRFWEPPPVSRIFNE